MEKSRSESFLYSFNGRKFLNNLLTKDKTKQTITFNVALFPSCGPDAGGLC